MTTAGTSQWQAPALRAANLASSLSYVARRLPESLALVHGKTRWSWGDLDERVSALAAGMTERGVRPGDCILLDGPNHPEYVQVMFAAWRIGAVLAPVNSRLDDRSLAQIASVCRPVLMVAHEATKSHACAVKQAVGGTLEILWLDHDGAESVGSFTPSSRPLTDCRVQVGDPAWYFFTSGTTGAPKAAVLTHDQLGYVITNHLADLIPITTEVDRSLVVAPLSHGAGIHLLPQVARGAASIIPTSSSLNPAEIWALVETEAVSNMFTVPTILKRLAEAPAVDVRDHSSLKYVIYAGAPMAASDQAYARGKLGDVLVQYYGLGEVTGNITVLPPRSHDYPRPAGVEFGTCGYPRTGMQISIQNETGTEVGPLQNGEICVAGPAVFHGYLDNPQATADAFRDGWFRTGDVGMIDESGYLYITGRLSDMFISGGSNIHPREIEEHLLGHPDVRDAVVLGMPDPTWGEVGVAVCVLRAGSLVAGGDIREWLTQQMARYKVPRHVVFWDDLPRSAYGKIVRRTVREKLVRDDWRAQGETPDGTPEGIAGVEATGLSAPRKSMER